jgi:hypothetical protein
MNNFQREQIWLLRKNGLGYSEVAKAIGLSKDSVKKYCKRHPELKGQGTLPYLMVEKRVGGKIIKRSMIRNKPHMKK